MIPRFDPAPGLVMLRRLADECLEQHTHERADRRHCDEPTAISALYDALACAREMLRHAKYHHELWQAAMDITTKVIQAAETAQPTVYGQYQPRYRRIRIAAAGLQITIADKAAQAQAKLTPPATEPVPTPARATPPPTITSQHTGAQPQLYVTRHPANGTPTPKHGKRTWM